MQGAIGATGWALDDRGISVVQLWRDRVNGDPPPVEYICAPDEGHGFRRPVNNMSLMAAAEAFLAKHVGGRVQEGGTPEVVARIKEITVDPKTVVLAAKVDAASVLAPKPVADLAAGTTSYAGAIVAGA